MYRRKEIKETEDGTKWSEFLRYKNERNEVRYEKVRPTWNKAR